MDLPQKALKETELYPALKAFLEAQGYRVKAEIGACDVMACRGEEDPVIVELKTAFSLSLFHQAMARQSITDLVYLAVPRRPGKRWARALRDNLGLCRRLGLGLIVIRLRDGFVEVLADPGPYAPRKSKSRKAVLLREFAKRSGDPNLGGQTRSGLVTAYRQDALRCVDVLRETGPLKGAQVAKSASVPRATRIMADNHYGWFERVSKGVYALTEKGRNLQGRSDPELF